MFKDFSIGDRVHYIPSYRGYYAAVVVGYDGARPIIKFSSGQHLVCLANELTDNLDNCHT